MKNKEYQIYMQNLDKVVNGKISYLFALEIKYNNKYYNIDKLSDEQTTTLTNFLTILGFKDTTPIE